MKILFPFLLSFSVSFCFGQNQNDSSITAECIKYFMEGDSCYRKADTISARKYWNKALGIYDGCSIKERIGWLDGVIICCPNDTNKKYCSIISNADRLLVLGEVNKARAYYEEALKIKPSEYPANQIKDIDLLYSIIHSQEEYINEITLGDSYFGLDAYAEALTHYQKAQKINPEEQYPKDQITECEKLLKKK